MALFVSGLYFRPSTNRLKFSSHKTNVPTIRLIGNGRQAPIQKRQAAAAICFQQAGPHRYPAGHIKKRTDSLTIISIQKAIFYSR